MNFSENQVRQLFIAKAYKATAVVDSDAVGTISVHSNTDGDVYFKYRGVDGVMRSDLIPKSQILIGKATPAANMSRGLQKYEVTLDSTVNSGAPLASQDYLLRIVFREYIGLSPEDQYFKYGVVHAVTGMTAATFYETFQASLIKNFKYEVTQLLKFTLKGTQATIAMDTNSGVTLTAVDNGTPGNAITFAVASVSAEAASVTVTDKAIVASLTAAAKTIADLKSLIASDPSASALVVVTGIDGTAVSAEDTPVTLATGTTTGLVVEEIEQPWVMGRMESMPVKFTLQPDQIVVSGDELTWGVVTAVSATTTVTNGKKIADLEYFLMGERGDIYRNVGFPYVINTTYQTDPTLKYNMLDIHYYYVGGNEMVQKSEKDISIAFPSVGGNLATQVALANSVIAAFNTASGITVTALPTS